MVQVKVAVLPVLSVELALAGDGQLPVAPPLTIQVTVPLGVVVDVPVTIAVKLNGVPTTAVEAGEAIRVIDGEAEAMAMVVAGDEVAEL